MRAFLKNLISRFVKPQYIVGAGDDITKINYDEPNVQLDKVHIGKLKKLLEEGDISSHAASKFMKGVRVFYESAVAYGLSHLPLDELIKNAQFVDIKRRLEADFTQVAYFVERFSELLRYTDVKSQELFVCAVHTIQTMQDSSIPIHIWNDAKVREKDSDHGTVEYHRMDILWAYSDSVKDAVTGQPAYSLLAKVAKYGGMIA